MHKIRNGKRVKCSPEEIKAIEAAWAEEARLQEERNKLAYRSKRAREYPSIGDQLDALLKQLHKMQQLEQVVLHTDLKVVIDKWQQVKAKYPKEQ